MDLSRKADQVVDLGYKTNKKETPLFKPFMFGWVGSSQNSPFKISFVYLPDNKLVVVKGDSDKCSNYIEENYPLSIVNNTIWKNGEVRRSYLILNVPGKERYNIEKIRHNNRMKWAIVRHYYIEGDTESRKEVLFTFKRLPKKWGEILKKLEIRANKIIC